MRIDHVIYFTSDLDAATERLSAELGVPAVGGGRHDGIGTINRIIPLGGGYLEVLAIADPEEVAASALGSALAARAGAGDGLAGWAVAVDDVEPIAARLGTQVMRIGRQGLTAQLTGVVEAMGEPCLPFFIARDHGIPDPGTASSAGGITWVEVAGDPDRLRDWLGGADLPVRVVAGAPALLAVGVGEYELRP